MSVSDLVVKTVYHDDVRRFKLAQVSLVHLRDLISKAYEKLPAFSIKYTDPEGDVCSIGSDAELEEAFNVSGSTLKLDVTPLEEVRAPLESKTSFKDVEPKSAMQTEKIDEVPKESPEQAQEEKGGEPAGCCGLFLQLVQDKGVQAKLPEIIESVLATVEKGELNIKSILSNLFVAVPSLRENVAVQKILPIIASHGEKINATLDQGKAYIPMILPMLKNLPEMIPQLIGSLDLLNLDDLKDHFKELFTRDSGCHFPCEQPTELSENIQGDGVAVHENVKCDGCGTVPITGDRYKCTVCHNFDLCSACEQKNIHPNSHPLLKLKEAPRRDIHYGVTCDGCGVVPIQGVRFKCLVCPNYDLCGACEAKNSHPSSHTLLKIKERKSCGRFGYGRSFFDRGHHGYGWGHRGHQGFWRYPGFGQCEKRPFHGMFKGLMKILGLNLNKCAWKAGIAKECHRSGSVRPDCRRGESVHGRSKSCGYGRWRQTRCKNSNPQLDAEFVQDVNYPDGSILAAGVITKQWQMKNVGSVAWPEGSKLIFVRGNRELLGEIEEFAIPLAKPGETVDISCPITVPSKAGHYSAYFKLADKDRSVFGHRFWIEFDVKDDQVAKDKPETKKEVVEGKEETKKVVQGLNSTIPSIYPSLEPVPQPVQSLPKAENSKFASALAVLEKMGFGNEKLNASLLDRAQGNVEQVVTWLLEMENTSANH
jgi:hypothetical protein